MMQIKIVDQKTLCQSFHHNIIQSTPQWPHCRQTQPALPKFLDNIGENKKGEIIIII